MFDFIKRLFQKKEVEIPQEIETETSNFDQPDEEEIPVVASPLEHLWEKFRAEKYNDIIAETQSIIEANDPNKKEALKLLGLAYFRQQKYDLAEETNIQLTQDSENPDDWFNLLTSATLNNNIELSETACAKIIEFYNKNATKENLPIPQVFFFYMHALRDIKAYDKAFVQLERLKDIYCSLVITDPTFLYLRGVPFFSDAMEAGKEILENIDKDKTQKLLAEMHSRLDDEGKQYIDEFEQRIKYKS